MDKYDRHSDELRDYYPTTSRQSFDQSHDRNGPHGYRNGGGGAVFGRDEQRAYDNPQIYPLPPDGGAGFGFGVASGGGGGYGGGFRGGDGERFIPVGRDGRGFGTTVGGDGGGYQSMGEGGGGGGYHHGGNGGDGGFRPVGSDFSSLSVDGLDFPPMDGGAGGFQPMGGGYAGRGSGSESFEVKRVSGQKREYPFSGVERSQERGTGFAKLFVGSVPRTATEDDIRPLFDKHGRVLEVAFIRDKRTGQQQGCCFVKYASPEEADGAIRALHNQYVLPGAVGPIQVRYADGERERLGATEYKLFVGSLNKQATEKEIEEIFLPFGTVEDVYIMRDENKQSRGCGFVKYTRREVAEAAINAINGRYTMRGCDMPLTVRFADPKRPRPGEYRGGPSSGESGVGPGFTVPGNRPPAHGGPPHGYASTTSWPLVSPQHFEQPSYAGDQGRANQFSTISTSATAAPVDGFPGSADGTHLVPTVSSAQGSKSRPQQQLQPQHVQRSNIPPGQISASYADAQMPYGHSQSSQRQASVAHTQLLSNPRQASVMDNHRQPPAHQSPSQLAQMLSQQKQTLQETYQSSQQALSQLQQQVMQLQPSNQNPSAQQGALAERQQSPWAGIGSQPAPTAAKTTALPAVATLTPSVTATSCNWTDHVSPDGYKYYYNSVTGESKWEKPEELVAYERQQQQQQKPSSQHPPAQSYPSGPSMNHAAPNVQSQFQGQYQGVVPNRIGSLQQTSQSSSYQLPGVTANQSQKELGYSQIPAGRGPVSDPSSYQQGVQASQWKK